MEEQLAYFNSIVNQLLLLVPPEPRTVAGSFLFAIDHCFAIKGQGTVLTGTVLNGKAAVNDTIELAGLRIKKKVKSMQMFKQPVLQCQQVSSCHSTIRKQEAITMQNARRLCRQPFLPFTTWSATVADHPQSIEFNCT